MATAGYKKTDRSSLLEKAKREKLVRKRHERAIFGTIALAVFSFFGIAIYTKGAIFEDLTDMLGVSSGLESSSQKDLFCLAEKNRTSPVCRELFARPESDWKQVTRGGGKQKAFQLHGK